MTPERLEIGGVRHYRTPAGTFPSVTAVLSATRPEMTALALADWRKRVGEVEAERVRESAAARGTRVHQAVEDWLTGAGYLDPDSLAPVGDLWWESLKPFLHTIVDCLAVESYVWHKEVRVAGALDAVTVHRSKRVLVDDWKTVGRPFLRKSALHEYKLQVSAYYHAARETHGVDADGAAIVTARESGSALTYIFDRAELADLWAEFRQRAARYHYLARRPVNVLVMGDRGAGVGEALDRLHERVGIGTLLHLGPTTVVLGASRWAVHTGCPYAVADEWTKGIGAVVLLGRPDGSYEERVLALLEGAGIPIWRPKETE